jgi:hypothetical protein
LKVFQERADGREAPRDGAEWIACGETGPGGNRATARPEPARASNRTGKIPFNVFEVAAVCMKRILG